MKETQQTLSADLEKFNSNLIIAIRNFKEYKENLMANPKDAHTKAIDNVGNTLSNTKTKSDDPKPKTSPIYSAKELATTKTMVDNFRKTRPITTTLSTVFAKDILNNNNANTVTNPNNNSSLSLGSMDVN